MNKRGSAFAITITISLLLIGGLSALYFLIDDTRIQWLSLALLFAVFLFLVIDIVRTFTSPSHHLKKSIKEMHSLIKKEPLETLREKYVAIYESYMKLSEKKKQHFYQDIHSLRETIEDQLQAEKKVEELLQQSSQGTVQQQQQIYELLHTYSQKLPQKVQEKFYPQIVAMKEKLSRGT